MGFCPAQRFAQNIIKLLMLTTEFQAHSISVSKVIIKEIVQKKKVWLTTLLKFWFFFYDKFLITQHVYKIVYRDSYFERDQHDVVIVLLCFRPNQTINIVTIVLRSLENVWLSGGWWWFIITGGGWWWLLMDSVAYHGC